MDSPVLAVGSPHHKEEARWHVVFEGDSHGPYDVVQIGELITSNRIDWDSFVWCEGYEEWRPAREIEELVDALRADADRACGSTNETAVRSPEEEEKRDSGPVSMGADPFAEIERDEAVFSRSFYNGSEQSPPMTGARNESSVLFSLQNLRGLATDSASAGGMDAARANVREEADRDITGSGLIDIRALAAASGFVKNDNRVDERDELLFSSSSGVAFEALASPIAAPRGLPAETRARNRQLFVAIATGQALIAAAMVAAAVVFVHDGDGESVPSQFRIKPAPVGVDRAATADTPSAIGPAEVEGASVDTRDVVGDGVAENGVRKPVKRGARPKRGRRKADRPPDGDLSAPPSPSAVSTETVTERSTAGDTFEKVLSELVPSKDGEPDDADEPAGDPARPRAGSFLPVRPSKDEVKAVLRALQPQIRACSDGTAPLATVSMVVGSSGRVRSARVREFSGPMAACIARAVRKARFPQFRAGQLPIQFPYRL